MCANRDHALNWEDPEGVHDMRVLSRRLRSTITDFRPYFGEGSLPRAKIRAIADKLGDVRDEDVALMALEELASKAKGKAAEGIELVAAQRKEKQTKARDELIQSLAETAVNEFQKEFLAKLRTISIKASSAGLRSRSTTEGLSFRALGVQVIRARLKDFTAASACLYLPYAVKDHHELRILAKRLRYSIELFSVCWGKEVAASAKEIAHLQTSLGELHDCDVWINDFGKWLKRTTRKANLEPDELHMRAGAIWLLKHFTGERMEHYREALARLERWQADGFLEELAGLLDVDSAAPKPEN